jgi:cytochrome c oxidase subunit III
MVYPTPISINSALYYPTLLYFFNRNYYAEAGVYGFGIPNVHINLHCHGVLINPYKVPLLNTAVLVTSGFILTMAHSYLRVEFFRACYRFMVGTVAFGLYFIMLQAYEYTYSGFSMNDGVYGSIFYMLTGFHGFHVIIGTIFLIVVTCRLRLSHFTANNHFAFEAAA